MKTAAACSLIPFGVYEHSGVRLFIGAATTDSLPIKLTRSFTTRAGGTEDLPPPRFAQVVQVERLSVRVPADVRNAVRANGGRILVVPWGYGPDCSPASWTGKALWTTPGQRGVFAVKLRERQRWENGIPTVDVTAPWHVPYPSAVGFTSARKEPLLTLDELLSMYDSIPPAVQERPDDPERRKAIYKWAELHPNLASRQPLSGLVRQARSTEVTAPFNARESPVAGTYRFVIQLVGSDSVVLFGRTEIRATGLLWPLDSAGEQLSRPPMTPNGYYLYLELARSLSELPTRTPNRGHGGFLAASFEPVTISPDSTVWRAGAELLGSAVRVVADSVLKTRFSAAAQKEFAGLGRTPNYTPGRFVRRADGSVNLVVELRAGDELIGTILGARVSPIYLIQ